MKPIPAPSTQDESSPPSAADLIKSTPAGYSNSRRPAQPNVNRAYPVLLVLSTAVAVFFAFMYINKDVIVAGGESEEVSGEKPDTTGPSDAGSGAALLPRTDTLPGEDSTGVTGDGPRNLTTAPIHSRFEETNMRVQHILTATSNDGHVSRIDLEVPVLYQSRQLRWSPAEVEQANQLMVRLMDYQDKSRKLKSQGEQLLVDWNALIHKSIPTSKLRADSPSIPENQHAASVLSGPADSGTDGAVEIDPKEDKP